MRVIEVIPVGYQIIVGYSLDDLKHLKLVLDNMTFNMDGNKPEHVEANEYLHKRLYPEVADTLKELNANGIASDPK